MLLRNSTPPILIYLINLLFLITTEVQVSSYSTKLCSSCTLLMFTVNLNFVFTSVSVGNISKIVCIPCLITSTEMQAMSLCPQLAHCYYYHASYCHISAQVDEDAKCTHWVCPILWKPRRAIFTFPQCGDVPPRRKKNTFNA